MMTGGLKFGRIVVSKLLMVCSVALLGLGAWITPIGTTAGNTANLSSYSPPLEKIPRITVETTTTTTTTIPSTTVVVRRASRAASAPRGQAGREVILACIRQREHRDRPNAPGDYQTVSGTGKYRGAYQMDSDFWASYGDGSAATADQASPASQDEAAWRGYTARGYGPWPPSQGYCP